MATEIINGNSGYQMEMAKAVSLHEAGALTEAETLYRGILQKMPNHSPALHMLGVIEYQRGNYLRASELIEYSIRALGSSSRVEVAQLTNLALVNQQLGRFEEAAQCYRDALEIDANSVETLRNLAALYGSLSRDDLMWECLARLAKSAPNDTGALLTRMILMNDKGRYADCLQLADYALHLKPESGEFHCQKAVGLTALGRKDEALCEFETARKLTPRLAVAHFNAAKLLQENGSLEASATACEMAIAADPRMGEAYSLRVNVKRLGRNDRFWEVLSQGLSNIEKFSQHGKVQLHSALGQAYEKEAMFDESFHHYSESARIYRETNPFNLKQVYAEFEILEKIFTRELVIALSKSPGTNSTTPIFIVGLPRSGTTLVELITSIHTTVAPGGELEILDQSLDGFELPGGMILNVANVKNSNGTRMQPRTSVEVAHQYLENIHKLLTSPIQTRITDKMPGNFKKIGLISSIFPNAKIVHCIRDPVDNCLSLFFTQFSKGHQWSKDLSILGQYYRNYHSLMEHWRRLLPKQKFFDLQYESVVSDPEVTVRRLLEYLELEWEDKCLLFNETQRPVATASAAQVRKPIYTTSVKRWQPYARYLQPLFEALGDLAPENWQSEID